MLANIKDALANFPSGVVVVTTRDPDGNPWGFTASSFCSVSLQPALVSVCLAITAECFSAFRDCRRLNFNILAAGDRELATRFATRGSDKFGARNFSNDAWDVPMLDGAVAALSCRLDRAIECGDHIMLVGEVDDVNLSGGNDSMVYYRRGFWSVEKPAQQMRLNV